MNGSNAVLVCQLLCCFLLQTTAVWKFPKDQTHEERSQCLTSDGRNGICKVGCDAVELVSDRRNICGFRKSDIILCCPEEKGEILQKHGTTYPTLKQVCYDQKRLEESKRNLKLDVIIRKTIGAGWYAWPNEHPHMAVLGWNTTGGGKEWFCGGSLIHPSYVLTAAHCLDLKGAPAIVRIGGISLLADEFNLFVVDYEVKETLVHPSYRESEFYNDIALLRIEKVGSQRQGRSPKIACLYLERDPPEKTLLTMGYGAPAFGRTFTYRLVQLNQTLMENKECTKFYEPNLTRYPHGITDTLVCAHDPKNIHDTCEGDSGGPMQFIEKDWKKTPYIFAVVSFGKICLTGTPGVYTRVHPYLDWIEEVLSRDGVGL